MSALRYRRALVSGVAVLAAFCWSLELVGWPGTDLLDYVPGFVRSIPAYSPASGTAVLFDPSVPAAADTPLGWPLAILTARGGPFAAFGAVGETLAIAVAGTLFALPAALIVGTVRSRRVLPAALTWPGRALAGLLLATPVLVVGLALAREPITGAVASTIVVALVTAARLGRPVTAAIDAERVPVLDASGTDEQRPSAEPSRSGAVTPNAVVAALSGAFATNVRIGVVLGLVVGGGVGGVLREAYSATAMSEAGTALVATAALVVGVDALTRRLRDRLTDGTVSGLAVRGFPGRFDDGAYR